ncbi:ABC transporter permease [Paenibacillus sp. GCM10023248]|uniref:ABC transporter permease n=1 Tax=Bacillales TaxID=1385 RepID=UPI0023799AA4|nr:MULTISPECIES: ABC transporter permease [Bacillales]MDD9265498.1 ABC transporter permease [Paenibacillus sp. MAHUQ-63]MDR6882449.1 osmoprotectant transport system permease protein [Bacillus sp. 3255]
MSYLFNNWEKVGALFGEHVLLTFTSLGMALLFAFPIGFLVAKYRRLHTPVTGMLGIVYTIPSMALYAALIPYTGLGVKTATIGLVAYAQMILVRNIISAIKGIDPMMLEAAKGMGMSKWQIVWKIEMPLSVPVILAGIRIATVSIISIGTIAAWIGGGGLGTLIFQGLNHQHTGKIIAGTIAITLLAIAADGLFRLIEKLLRPKLA